MAIFNKSVLGQPFDDFVQDQLKVRSKKLSSADSNTSIGKENINKESDLLQYTIAKTAFLRLSSGVDISEELALSLFGNPNYAGSGLAKSHILQAGTLNKKGGLRGGFSGANSAYTLGGIADFGLRPMPGITSAKISSKGRWGSLREANVTIKCFNRDQLSIVELLYLRPGYTILLEWGHTEFWDNNGNLVSNVQFLDLFQEGMTRNQFYKDMLRKQRQYSGNFDCFIGPVVNFNVNQNGDGSYDCQLNAYSWGYVIESLKINAAMPSYKGTSENIKNEESKSPFKGASPTDKFNEIVSKSTLNSILKSYYNTCNKSEFNDKRNHKIYIRDIYGKDMDQDKTGHSVSPSGSGVDSGSLATFSAIPFTIASNNDLNASKKTDNTNINVYMPLGSLLAVISKNCLLHNTPEDPIVNINFNTSENYCLSPEYHLSIDPQICLIKHAGKDLEQIGLSANINKINPFLPDFKRTTYTGNTMNIMVNINYIIRTLNQLELSNDQREVNLYSFLEEIMRGITIALGRVNQFNVGIDDETNTLTIYDKQLLEVSPKEISIINSTGLKSVVRKININSKLSNELGKFIAIGAQASGVALGVDASVLSQYNKGLTDRVMTIKQSHNYNPSANKPQLSENTVEQTLDDFLKDLKKDERAVLLKRVITDIYLKQIITADDIENAKDIYGDFLNTVKAKDPITKASQVIPFTFNVTLDGISGIKYGQMFSIEPTRLPKSFLNPRDKTQPSVGFLVYSIDHEISNNTWLTEIKGQAAPLRDAAVKS